MGTVTDYSLSRPLLVAETIRGRRHAYRGLELGGEVRVPRRGVRSLCGVPCKGTSKPFIPSDDELTCQVCSAKMQEQEGR